VILVVNPSTRSFLPARCRGHPSNLPSGWKRLTVRAAGADAAFCVHVERTRSKDGDYEPPGVTGEPGSVVVPNYDFTVTSRGGEC
jgi:hypothetical protein